MASQEKKLSKKEKKAAESAAQALAQEAAMVARQKQRRLMIAIPLLTAGAVAGCWFGLNDKRLVGVSILVGGLIFLMVALGSLGSAVTPRDRLKSGSIDFGGGEPVAPPKRRGKRS